MFSLSHIRHIVGMLVLIAFMQPAKAGYIDFEGFSDGEILTSQTPGLTFNDATILTAGASLNEFDFPPHSGNSVIYTGSGLLNIGFDSPVSGVSAYVSYVDAVGIDLTLYDINEALLAYASFASPAAGIVNNQYIALGAAGIRRMVISLSGVSQGNEFIVDDLSYVPEPTAMALIVAGVAGWHVSASKNRQTRNG